MAKIDYSTHYALEGHVWWRKMAGFFQIKEDCMDGLAMQKSDDDQAVYVMQGYKLIPYDEMRFRSHP